MKLRSELTWAERHGWRGWRDVPVLLLFLAAYALLMAPSLAVIYINCRRLGWI